MEFLMFFSQRNAFEGSLPCLQENSECLAKLNCDLSGKIQKKFIFNSRKPSHCLKYWQGKHLENDAWLPVRAPGPPFQSAAVPSAPTPSPFSSSPQHELPAVSAGMPAPAAASLGCGASPVRSASWAASCAAIKTCRRRSARSGPAAGLL